MVLKEVHGPDIGAVKIAEKLIASSLSDAEHYMSCKGCTNGCGAGG